MENESKTEDKKYSKLELLKLLGTPERIRQAQLDAVSAYLRIICSCPNAQDESEPNDEEDQTDGKELV